jgi:hypothetical protein
MVVAISCRTVLISKIYEIRVLCVQSIEITSSPRPRHLALHLNLAGGRCQTKLETVTGSKLPKPKAVIHLSGRNLGRFTRRHKPPRKVTCGELPHLAPFVGLGPAGRRTTVKTGYGNPRATSASLAVMSV